MLYNISFDGTNNVLAEIGFVCHRQKHAADFQFRVDLPPDVLHRVYQLRHVLRCQIVCLDGYQHMCNRLYRPEFDPYRCP